MHESCGVLVITTQTCIKSIFKMIFKKKFVNNVFCIKEFDNLSVEKKTLSTALGFEPRSFDCLSNALTTELHRRPTSPSPQEDLLISPSGSALRL